MAAPVPDLHELWVDSGRPGAHKFRQILIRKGIAAPSEKYISEHFLRYQTSKQLFAPGPRYTGKIWSPGLDRRWQADVLVNSQKPSEFKGQKWQYALVVVDVFSRYIWTRLVTSPMEANVAFGEIIDAAGKSPEVLSTDADPGFLSPKFKELLASKGIQQSIRAGRNDIAIADRAIYTLKRTLAIHSLETGQNDWAQRLDAAVKAYNDNPHGALMDGAPDDIRGPGGEIKHKLLYFNREQQEAANMETNSKHIQERAERLEQHGAFRIWKHKERLGRRVFEPGWSRETHEARHIDGAFVKDEQGHSYPTKETLSIPKESTELPEPVAILNPKTRGLLQRYADRLRVFLMGQEDNKTAASKATSVFKRGRGL